MIIGSCGHELGLGDGEDSLGIKVSIKYSTREWTPAIAYMTVCDKCYSKHLEDDLVLHTEHEEKLYLEGEID